MARQRQRYEIDMCSGAILPKLLQFTLPLMCSSILQLLFNAADIVVVGRFAGDNSLAAVGSNASLISLLVNLFIGLSVGANILAARYYGAGEKESLCQTVHTAMLLGLLSGCFLTVVGVLGARTILVWMQSPPEVLPLAAVYLRIYFLGMPATMLYNFGAALLRAVGDTRRPLYYLTVAGVVNVALNLFFVIVCHLDVAGVGIATVISQCISAALVVRCMMREQGAVHLELRQLRFFHPRMKQILYTGLPAGFQGVLFSLSNVMIQSSVNSFGSIVIAGNAAGANVGNFVYQAMNTFQQAITCFAGQNAGARKPGRIITSMKVCMFWAFSFGVVLGVLSCVFGRQLLSLYSTDPAVIAAGMERIVIVCGPYFLCGIMDVMTGVLRGIGYSLLPMIVSLLGACAFRILWVMTVFAAAPSTTCLMLSYPVSWLLTFSVLVVIFCLLWRRLRRQYTPEELAAR